MDYTFSSLAPLVPQTKLSAYPPGKPSARFAPANIPYFVKPVELIFSEARGNPDQNRVNEKSRRLQPIFEILAGITKREFLVAFNNSDQASPAGELADEMVRGIRGYRQLEGYRGHPPADTPAIEDILLRVARLVEEVPEISELDLNPVFALDPDHGCQIVDARIRVKPLEGKK